jgi:thiol-disulfide isomerase/thioredoxin
MIRAKVAPMSERAPPAKGIVIQPRVLAVGGGVALLGLLMAAAFLWMVPNAAARESKAACRGLRGDQPVVAQLCSGPTGCELPVRAPDFTAVDHAGKPVKLSDFRGKVVLINFWASWCGVCRTEKPALRAMADDMASDDFVVIALASDRSWSDVLVALVEGLAQRFKLPEGSLDLKQALDAYSQALPNGVPFKVLLDPPAGDGNSGAIAAAWGIKAVPESALIDRDGMIRAYFVNKRDWASPVAQTCLRSVLDE